MTPISRPPSTLTLRMPTISVITIGISDGRIISRCAALVTMSTQLRVVGLPRCPP